MEIYQVLETCYILSLELAYILEITKKVRDLPRDDSKAWSDSKGMLKNKDFNKVFNTVIKRLFLE